MSELAEQRKYPTLGHFHIGRNAITAEWLNLQEARMERGPKLLLEIALNLGEVLSAVQAESTLQELYDWLEKNVTIKKSTAYKYILLFVHKDHTANAKNLDEAYKIVETLEAQKKLSEGEKARQRIVEYQKTGVKPKGWRQHTDDKLAKEGAERDARIKAAKQEAQEEKPQAQREPTVRMDELEREIEQGKAKNEQLRSLIGESMKAENKRLEFKERIRLSADGAKDPFIDALIDYLEGMGDDNRRIEACYNLIKVCKGIAVELQGSKGATA